MNFYTGDLLDLSGMNVEAVFSDGTVQEISDYSIMTETELPFMEPGKQTVTIKYLDKTFDFEINVINSIFAFTQQPV